MAKVRQAAQAAHMSQLSEAQRFRTIEVASTAHQAC